MERLVYVNGAMVEESAATISIFDVGRMYGATFYESIRTFHHKLFHLERHFERLRNSLAYAGFLSALDFARVEEAARKTLEANEHLTHADDDLWICVEVTPGTAFPMPLAGQKDATPTVIAYSSALPHGEYARCYTEGKSVITSLYRNVPPQSFEQRCKNRSRSLPFPFQEGRLSHRSTGIRSHAGPGGLPHGGHGRKHLSCPSRRAPDADNEEHPQRNQPLLRDRARRPALHRSEGTRPHPVRRLHRGRGLLDHLVVLHSPHLQHRREADRTHLPRASAKRLLDEWSSDVGVDIVAQSQRFARKGA